MTHDRVVSVAGPAYYRVKRPSPFPTELPPPPHEPVYSGNTVADTRSTFPSKSSPLYPGLPPDVNGTGTVPYSSQPEYPPATWTKPSAPVGETTPLLQ